VRQTIPARIDIIQDTKSLTITEDTLFTWSDGTRFTLMAADGAPQRLKTTGSMRAMLDAYGPGTAPGRYAALLARTVTAGMAAGPAAPSDFALAVNARLRANLEAVYGELTAEAVLAAEPTLTQLAEDPRYLRWILPICCYTLAQVDLERGAIHYAHAGDTAIFALYRDGRTAQITSDRMAQHDDKMRYRLREIMQDQPVRGLEDLQPHLGDIMALNQYNGIYHNYVDEGGAPDPEVGVGVINGLAPLADYLETGVLAVDELDGLLLTTDGMFWPAPLDESAEAAQARVDRMGRMIREQGLQRYVAALREEERSDADGRKYQRFGNHDDASALLLTFAGDVS
jgi:hypothetical protein